MTQDLTGMRVVITAGASGIGRAIAESFLAAGARVHICDVDPAALSAFRTEVSGVAATPADVSDPDQVARLFEAAAEGLGGLDILVNNAGIAGPAGPVEDCSIEDWRRTLAVGLDSQFYCLRHAVPLLKAAGGGSIVNLASTAGIMGYPLRTPYVAAKWGVVGLSKSLAVELGPHNIRVNAICPGSVDGPRMDRVIAAEASSRGMSREEVRQSYVRSTSLRCFVTAQDIANMALFVCSEAGARITGQTLVVDGNTESLSN